LILFHKRRSVTTVTFVSLVGEMKLYDVRNTHDGITAAVCVAVGRKLAYTIQP